MALVNVATFARRRSLKAATRRDTTSGFGDAADFGDDPDTDGLEGDHMETEHLRIGCESENDVLAQEPRGTDSWNLEKSDFSLTIVAVY